VDTAAVWQVPQAREPAGVIGSAGPESRPTSVAALRGTQRLRFAVVLVALAFGAFAAVHAPLKAADFYVFWAAARHAANAYDPRVIAALEAAHHVQGAWPFVYPPTFLLFVRPFALLPLQLAYPIWTGLSAALFTYAASHLVRPALTLALLVTPPVVLAIAPGQTSLVVGAAMIGGCLMRGTRPATAGALLAIAAAIKPQAMILAPIVLWGDWRTLRWAGAVGAGLAVASLCFGPGLWLEWPRALEGFAAVVPTTDRINPSALTSSPLWSAALGVLGVCLALKWRNLTGLIAGALCLTPYAHEYDLAPLAPVALVWIVDLRRSGIGLACAGAALLGGLVGSPVAALAFVAALALFMSRRRLIPSPLEARLLHAMRWKAAHGG